MKKDEIIKAIMFEKYATKELTCWAENMFFNYIGGEYFTYPSDERKYNEQFTAMLEIVNLAYAKKNKQAYKKAVKYVIYNFCSAVTQEFDCSYSYAQKVIVEAFGTANLEAITHQLIKECFEKNYSSFVPCDYALNEHKIIAR